MSTVHPEPLALNKQSASDCDHCHAAQEEDEVQERGFKLENTGRDQSHVERNSTVFSKDVLQNCGLGEDTRYSDAFLRVSGYHTLETELHWMKRVDDNDEWAKQWMMSPIPGSTHLLFVLAMFMVHMFIVQDVVLNKKKSFTSQSILIFMI